MPEAKLPKSNLRQRISNWVLVILSVAFVAYFYHYPESLHALKNIGAIDVFNLVALHFALFGVGIVRFRLILHKCADCHIPLSPWIRLFVEGRFLDMFVPQLGSVYRGLELHQKHGVAYSRYVITLIMLAWISTTISLILAYFLILVLSPSLLIGGYHAYQIVTLLLVALITAPLIGKKTLRPLSRKTSIKIVKIVNEVVSVAVGSIQDWRWLGKVSLLSAAVFALSTLTIHVCFLMLGSTPVIAESALFHVVLQLVAFVRITPGNVGPQELAFAILGSQASVGVSQGILASAIFRLGAIVVLTLSAFVVGAIGVIRKGRRNDHSMNP